MRTAFVTGGYGILGGRLVAGLLRDGVRVIVLKRDRAVRSALTLEGTEDRCHVVHGDVNDAALISRVVLEEGVDTVFHLAAQTIVGTANASPVSTFETNVRGTWNVLEAAREGRVERVVVAASDKAYGSHDELPYREDMALQPRFPYDVSKAATDLIARSYWHTFGVPVATTRFANIYGGGDLNTSRLVPELVRSVIDGRRPVIRSDGSPERDFLYVEDAAEAYLAIARALDGDGDGGGRARGEAYNAGGGRPVSIREVVATLLRVAGSDLEPDYQGTGTPHGEIDRQYVDTTKLAEHTGWAPQVDLEEGLRRTLDWYRTHRV